jgi:hypothetical protein
MMEAAAGLPRGERCTVGVFRQKKTANGFIGKKFSYGQIAGREECLFLETIRVVTGLIRSVVYGMVFAHNLDWLNSFGRGWKNITGR